MSLLPTFADVQTAARQPVDQRLRIEILHCPDPQVAT